MAWFLLLSRLGETGEIRERKVVLLQVGCEHGRTDALSVVKHKMQKYFPFPILRGGLTGILTQSNARLY